MAPAARQLAKTLAWGILACAVALSGCGSSSPAKKSAINFNGKSATIEFGSPQLAGHRLIPAQYTCDGHDVPPPIGWNTLPPNTQELALFVIGFDKSSKLSVRWAVTGIGPSVHYLPSGKLPPGSILGRNARGSTHYSLCPPRGGLESYLFVLYALPKVLQVHRGFSGTELLGTVSAANYPAPFGAFVTTYARA